jgi:hypothetical protein
MTLEASVCRQLCRGDITLEQAQEAQEENVLHLIPGEIIASAQHGFPPVDTCNGEFREVAVDVPDRFRARI